MDTGELVGMHALIILAAFIAAVTIGTFVIWFRDDCDESLAIRDAAHTRRLVADDVTILPVIDEVLESPAFGRPRPVVACMPGRTTPRKHFWKVCRGRPERDTEQSG